jgi:PRTRC genetic system protein A
MIKPLSNPIDYHIYTDQEIPAPGLYAYLLAGNGVIKLAETTHFRVAAPIYSGLSIVAGLPDYPIGLELKVPRIPARWLHSVLDHALNCGRHIEQMYHFHWWESAEWRVSAPRQQAGAGRVSYHGGDDPTIALDLHSHHAMNAFFSLTDDDDEQGLRLYGVIGRIYDRPELRLRVGVYGDWLELDPLDLFDGLGPFVEA